MARDRVARAGRGRIDNRLDVVQTCGVRFNNIGHLAAIRPIKCASSASTLCRLAVAGRGRESSLVSSPKDTKLSASITLTGRHITDTMCSKCAQELKYMESEGCEGGARK